MRWTERKSMMSVLMGLAIIVLIGVVMFTTATSTVQAEELENRIGTDVTPDYDFTIDMGMLIKPISITKGSVYVLDSNNNKVTTIKLKVEQTRRHVTLIPTEPYKYDEEYTIVFTDKVQSLFVNYPFKSKQYTFKTESDPTKFFIESIGADLD